MRVRFPSLLGESERANLEAAEAELDEFLERTRAEGKGTRNHYPELRALCRDEVLVVRDFAVASLPLLRRAEARHRDGFQLGLRAATVEDAVARVRDETGVDLVGTKVRVGIVRGHMLEITWFVPLDVAGTRESIEEATDELCERLLGTEDYETWVRSNHVAAAPRKSALRAIATDSAPTTYALEEAGELLRHTVSLLERERRSFSEAANGSWTVLELGEGEADAPQAERRFVSTTEPEAIKCFLEGALFASRRFMGDGSFFLSVVAEGKGEARARRRSVLEERLGGGEGRVLVGTGFSERADYFDLLVRDEAALGRLRDDLVALGVRATLEFWDTELEHESFEIRQTSG